MRILGRFLGKVKGLARKAFRTKVFRRAFRKGVDPLRLNQLPDELEVAEFSKIRPDDA